MGSAPSAAFERLIASVHAPIREPAQLKSLDLEALDELRDDELTAASAALAAFLDAGRDDPRIAHALALLETDAAWAALERTLDRPCDITVITAAHCLYQRQRGARAVDALRRCAGASEPALRGAALRTLARVDAPTGDVFLATLDDPSEEVRGAALSALLLHYDLDTWDNIIGSKAYTLTLGVTSPWPSLRQSAVADLRALIARLDAGEPPERLGIVAADIGVSDALSDLWDAVDDPDATLTPALVAALEPHERDYAVEYLSRPLARGDQRVIPLLAALGTPRAHLALEAAGAA